jgi:hypothetical protein
LGCSIPCPCCEPVTFFLCVSHPLQASFSIFVLFVSYVLHANYSPFLPRVTTQALQEISDSAIVTDGKAVNRRANAAPALAVKTADFVRDSLPLCLCPCPVLLASSLLLSAHIPSSDVCGALLWPWSCGVSAAHSPTLGAAGHP